MKDRVPGSPGRYSAVVPTENLQALQTGQPFTITLVRDDDPIEPGTPYSKAAVLPDSVAEAICPYVENPTPADAFMALHNGKAPAGYGYGEYLYIGAEAGESFTEKIDALTASWADNTSKQYTVYDQDFYNLSIVATISKRNSRYTTIDGITANGYKLIRRKVYITEGEDGVWKDWEWVNPPMTSGVEYRTTEKSGGEPVYVKRISVTESDISALSSSVTRYINHGISGFKRLVRCHAVMDNAYPLPHISYRSSGNPSIISINNVNMTTIVITAINIEQTAPSFTFDIYYCK